LAFLLIIFFIRLRIPIDVIEDIQVDAFRHGIYPPFKLEDDGSDIINNLSNTQSWTLELEDFMVKGLEGTGKTSYVP
jgi:hypothetical protein